MAILSHPEPLSGDLLIRPAQPGEEDVVLDLLAEAAAWLGGRGIAQWPARFPADSVRAQFEHVTDPPHARWPTSLYERKVSRPPGASR